MKNKKKLINALCLVLVGCTLLQALQWRSAAEEGETASSLEFECASESEVEPDVISCMDDDYVYLDMNSKHFYPDEIVTVAYAVKSTVRY